MSFKYKKPRRSRAGCKMCKPHKCCGKCAAKNPNKRARLRKLRDKEMRDET